MKVKDSNMLLYVLFPKLFERISTISVLNQSRRYQWNKSGRRTIELKKKELYRELVEDELSVRTVEHVDYYLTNRE